MAIVETLKPFDPETFIGKGWKLERGGAVIADFDPSKVKLVTHLKDGERSITSKERKERIKAAHQVALGADHFLYFLEHPEEIPEVWKEKVNGYTLHIFFDNDVVVSSDGYRVSLCLCWLDGRWCWDYRWLVGGRSDSFPSAVLASGTES